MPESEVRRCYAPVVDEGVSSRTGWRSMRLRGPTGVRFEYGDRVVIGREGTVIGIGYDRRAPEGVLAR